MFISVITETPYYDSEKKKKKKSYNLTGHILWIHLTSPSAKELIKVIVKRRQGLETD